MRALVYGSGSYFNQKKSAIKDEIIGFVDSYKTGELDGRIFYSPEYISKIEYDVIYVMARENAFCEMIYELLTNGVHRDKIIIGQNLAPYIWGEDSYISDEKLFFIDENNRLNYKFYDINIAFSTYDEFYGIRDVFCNRDYDFGMCGEKTIVCDIGMNIGAAALYFASRNDVIKVYSYEPFEPTYKTALYNIQKNPMLSDKIKSRNVGLGAYTAEQEMMYNPSMTCGLSTNKEISSVAKEQYKIFGLYKEEAERTLTVALIDAAEELAKIIRDNGQANLLIKLDCEGAEYEIIRKWQEEGLFQYINVIMMEWHYKGETSVRDILEKNGFYLFSFAKGISMGTIYAVNSRAKKYIVYV